MAIVFDTPAYFNVTVGGSPGFPKWYTIGTYTPTVTPKAIIVHLYQGSNILWVRYGLQTMTQILTDGGTNRVFQLVDPAPGPQPYEIYCTNYTGPAGTILAIENGHYSGQSGSDNSGVGGTSVSVTLSGCAPKSKLLSLFSGEFVPW